MKVVDAMTREVITVAPEASLKEAARIMTRHGVSGLPVVATGGHLVGVISASDIALKEAATARQAPHPGPRPLSRTALGSRRAARVVADAMTSPAITIHPEYTIAEAARVMIDRGVDRMPVVQDGRILGILARADLVRAFAREDAAVAHEIRNVLRALMIPDGAVEVSVVEGEVWLDGALDTEDRATTVVRAVEAVAGVSTVHSSIRALDR